MVAVVAAVAAVAGCGDEAGPAAPGGLSGRTFLSESVTEDGAPRPLVEGTRIRLAFAGGRVTASAGCNTMSGEVSVAGGRVTVPGGLAVTEMGCDPPRHAQDEWLAAFLAGGPAYRLAGDRLTLSGAATAVVLVDRRAADPDRPLEGTAWRLDGMVDGDVVSTVPGRVVATLRFGGGRVTLAVDGCNSGGGEVEIGPGELRFGVLSTTAMACAPDRAAVEAALVSVLRGTVAYRIEAASLTLTGGGGKGLVLRGGG